MAPASHLRAVLQALFVTVLWSSSWVLIKFGLQEIPPLTFAGLRYVMAALILLPVALRLCGPAAFRALTRGQWALLAVFGLVQYGITQGAQFLSLAYLPATTASLLLAFTPALVALFATLFLREPLAWPQWLGIAVFGVGALLYFGPFTLGPGQRLGLLFAVVGVAANAAQGVLGRYINRQAASVPLLVTAVSMTIGSVALLGTGVAVQGLPPLPLSAWLTVAWLAVVNTAFAFWLWNHTQRTLPAVESSVINNTMLIQIALLAWLFLGERPSAQQWAGIGLAFLGVLLVQVWGAVRARRARAAEPASERA
ncbi:MAG TPA: DMT family transporter [Caulobacteraceae bacterium]